MGVVMVWWIQTTDHGQMYVRLYPGLSCLRSPHPYCPHRASLYGWCTNALPWWYRHGLYSTQAWYSLTLATCCFLIVIVPWHAHIFIHYVHLSLLFMGQLYFRLIICLFCYICLLHMVMYSLHGEEGKLVMSFRYFFFYFASVISEEFEIQ